MESIPIQTQEIEIPSQDELNTRYDALGDIPTQHINGVRIMPHDEEREDGTARALLISRPDGSTEEVWSLANGKFSVYRSKDDGWDRWGNSTLYRVPDISNADAQRRFEDLLQLAEHPDKGMEW